MKTLRLLALTAVLATAVSANCQTSKDSLATHVRCLSDASLYGRVAGMPETVKAAEYIVAEFDRIGLDKFFPEVFQEYKMMKGKLSERDFLNIVAKTGGADESLKDELIVVCANYDGAGYKKDGKTIFVHPSANDNASGVAALIEIARELKKHEQELKRTVVFVAYDGGNLNPSGLETFAGMVDMSKVKLVVDLDKLGNMVGTGYSSVIGAATLDDGRAVLEKAASETGTEVNIKDVDGNVFKTPKSEPFARNLVPTLEISTLPTRNEGSVDDTPESLDYDGIVKISDFAAKAARYYSSAGTVASGLSPRKYFINTKNFHWGITAGVGYSYARHFKYLMNDINDMFGLNPSYIKNVAVNLGASVQYDFSRIFSVHSDLLLDYNKLTPIDTKVNFSQFKITLPVIFMIQKDKASPTGMFGGAGFFASAVLAGSCSVKAFDCSRIQYGPQVTVGLRQYNCQFAINDRIILNKIATGQGTMPGYDYLLNATYWTLSFTYYF